MHSRAKQRGVSPRSDKRAPASEKTAGNSLNLLKIAETKLEQAQQELLQFWHEPETLEAVPLEESMNIFLKILKLLVFLLSEFHYSLW